MLRALLQERTFKRTILQPRSLITTNLCEPGTSSIIDRGMVAYFQGPHSFTGEDSAELYIHSSNAVIAAFYRHLGRLAGIRLAEAGEFTHRAFLNGKLDLCQVEGLADLLMAETEAQRKLALRQLDGRLSKKFQEWRQILIQAMAMTEAWIDFSEDENIEDDTLHRVQVLIQQLFHDIEFQLNHQSHNEIIRNGLQVALCGPPNSGKSSILNCLVAREASIVSPIAGTTRDVLQQSLDVNGQTIILYDTAGIRDSTDDIIESEGIKRAKKTIELADHILMVLDSSQELKAEQVALISSLDPKKLTIILNKVDLPSRQTKEYFVNLLPHTHNTAPILENSCIDHRYKVIEPYLIDLAAKWQDHPNETFALVNERQKLQAIIALNELSAYLKTFKHDIVMGAEHLRRATLAIGRISGSVDCEDILDALFSTFCIGK